MSTRPRFAHPARPPMPDDASAREAREIGEVVGRLRARFPAIDQDRIRGVVDSCHEAFRGRPIRDFVPILVERLARDELARTPSG